MVDETNGSDEPKVNYVKYEANNGTHHPLSYDTPFTANIIHKDVFMFSPR